MQHLLNPPWPGWDQRRHFRDSQCQPFAAISHCHTSPSFHSALLSLCDASILRNPTAPGPHLQSLLLHAISIYRITMRPPPHFIVIYIPQHKLQCTTHLLCQMLHCRTRICLRHQPWVLKTQVIRRPCSLSVTKFIFSQKILFYKPMSIDSKCNEMYNKVVLKKPICGKKLNEVGCRNAKFY